MERVLEDSGVTVQRVSGVESLAAANGFYEAVLSRSLVHPLDPMTASHVGAVTSDGVWSRRSASADVDAAVALTLAHHGVLHAPRGPSWSAY